MQDLSGRNAVVTGGGSGIGRGIALALGDAGVNVAVVDIEAANAEAVAKEVEGFGVRAVALQCDVTDEESLAACSRAVAEALGAVHILSNNAGVIVPQGTLDERSAAEWEYVFSVNVFGIVKSVQAFLPGMRAHGEGGHIVNTSSMAGLVAIPEIQVGIYTASKYACNGYSEYLRAELAPSGIGVSVFCPGMIESNLSVTSARNRPAHFGGPQPAPEGNMSDEMRAQMMSGEDAGRIVVRAIRDGRLHIVTHPETRPLVQMRFDQIMADYDAEEAAQKQKE